MANTNFENFFNHIWDNNIDLIEADFYLKILTAILYLDIQEDIKLAEEMTK